MSKTKKLVLSSLSQLEKFIQTPLLFGEINVTSEHATTLGQKQCDDLSKAITQHSGLISSVRLINLGITDSSALKICEALSSRKVSSTKHPKILDFSHNFLTDKSVEVFKSLSFKLKLLYLQNNYFGDEALKFKGSVLSNNIDSVNLNENYIISTGAISKFPCFSQYILCNNQKNEPNESDDCELIGGAQQEL